jgi:hypothetical protein
MPRQSPLRDYKRTRSPTGRTFDPVQICIVVNSVCRVGLRTSRVQARFVTDMSHRLLKDGLLKTLERLYSDRWSLVHTQNFEFF